MTWNVEYTDEFGEWWGTWTKNEQESVATVVGLLEAKGPQLPFPIASVEGCATDTCVNSVSSTGASLTAFCMPSIDGVPPFC